MRIVFKFDLFDIVLWVRENVNNSSIYIDHTICAPEYSVTIQHGTFEGDIAMRQYKLLPSDVTIYKIRQQHKRATLCLWGWHCHNTKNNYRLTSHLTITCVGVCCSVDLQKDDPRWVGAWWLAFFITMTTCWLVVVPFSLFGSELPSMCIVHWSRFCHCSKMDNVYTS